MKWTNKGHEFDTVYQNIEKKDKFYLFGAGEYGEAVYQELEDKLSVAGFIDNNPEKQKEHYLGKRVFDLEEIVMKMPELL